MAASRQVWSLRISPLVQHGEVLHFVEFSLNFSYQGNNFFFFVSLVLYWCLSCFVRVMKIFVPLEQEFTGDGVLKQELHGGSFTYCS